MLPGCTVAVDRLAVGDGTGESHAFFVEPGARALETRWANRGDALALASNAPLGRASSLSSTPLPSLRSGPDAHGGPPPTPVLAVLRRCPRPRWCAPGSARSHRSSSGSASPPPPPPPGCWCGRASTRSPPATPMSRAPPRRGTNDGASRREVRTDVLIASTAVLGVATAVVGVFFTEWSGRGSERSGLRTAPSLGLRDGGLQVGVVRSF
ncbi:MAG: hypothetical protein IPF99_26870 [Deltaproteobacteria bacterium]|nr:hypothetical protein [Deltaproteobacteria bacterium]